MIHSITHELRTHFFSQTPRPASSWTKLVSFIAPNHPPCRRVFPWEHVSLFLTVVALLTRLNTLELAQEAMLTQES